MWCWLVLLSFSLGAQTITIKDKENLEPLEMVSIVSESTDAYAITNAQGQASLADFSKSDRLVFYTIGYKKQIKTYSELASLNFELLLEPTNLSLEEVVVSATGWRESTGNVPFKIMSISAKEVALQNPQTAADLLGVSGKVYVQKSQQGGGSPMIRGFATNRLLYTIDGVRMNTAIFRGGNVQNVISLDPFAMQNTEVLFGPGSVIYGSDAIGGVMSFKTLTPQFSLNDKPLVTGKSLFRYSSANQEKTGHFDVNVGWKKWALVTSASSWDYNHLKQGSHGPDEYLKSYYVQRTDSVDRVVQQDDPLLQIPTAYSQINFMQKLRFSPSKKWNFEYGFHLSETSPYGRYDRHNRVRSGTARYAEWNYGPQKWLMNNLAVRHTGKSKIYDQVTLRLAQQTFGESRVDRSLNKNGRSVRAEEVQAYSANLNFIKSQKKRGKLFYGLEFVRNEVLSTGREEDIVTGLTTVGPSRYPQSDWNTMAAYVNQEFKASERMTIQGGLRYSYFKMNADFDTTIYPFPFTEASIENGALTGSLGLVFRPTEKWVLNANFGTAYRSPNVDDMGKVFDSEPGAVVVPNPNLKAEYAYNFDVGIAKVFADLLKIDVTGYYTVLQNALVNRNFSLNGQDSLLYDGRMSRVQALQNAAIATVYGLQAGLELSLPSGFRFSTDVNYQVGEEELDDGSKSPSRHAAPFFGTSRLSFKVDKLHLQLYSNYQGERAYKDLAVSEQAKDEIYAKDMDGNNYAPSWYTLNFKAMYHFSKHFTVTAGIENITDQRYRTYSSGVSAPGKNFVMALRANF